MTVDIGSNNVLSLLATLVDLYREAGTLLDQHKAKCAQQRTAAPSRVLEENIDLAPEEIEKEKKRGESRFADRFELGDEDAISELHTVLAQVQSELVDSLAEIADSDDEVDYTALADAADAGRDAAISALLSLKRRLMEAESRKKSIASSQRSDSSKQTLSSQEATKSDDTTQDQTNSGAETEKERPRRNHSNSLLGFFKHHRNRSGSGERSPARQRSSSKRLSIPGVSPAPRSVSQEDTRTDISQGNRGNNGTPGVHDASVSSTESSSKGSNASTVGMRSSSSASTSLGNAPATISLPNPDNDYLGFCKSAVKLQAGDRQAMQRTKEFNDGWSSSKVFYLTCSNSKCAFASHLDIDSIWTKVWLIDEVGMKFRWPFLAKSHIAQGAKAKQSEYAYRCLFCVFLGQEAPVINGSDSYLEHVSEKHRGQVLDEVVLQRTSCVADRVCDDEEDFDINLFPMTAAEYTKRLQQDGHLPDEAADEPANSAMNPLEPIESNDANIPWCEDMPEFKPTDTLEAIERQFSIRSFSSVGHN